MFYKHVNFFLNIIDLIMFCYNKNRIRPNDVRM